MRMICSLVILILLAGCAGSVGSKRTVGLYKDAPQVESFASIVDQYGEPTASWQTGDSQSVHQYQYVKHRYSPLAYLPIIFYFTSTSGVNYEVVYLVDADDKVVETRKFFSRFKGSNPGVCSRAYSPSECIKSVRE